jgi:hypothetical protein
MLMAGLLREMLWGYKHRLGVFILRWEARGVGLDGHPCSSGEAVNPSLGATPLTEIQVFGKPSNTASGETLRYTHASAYLIALRGLSR